MGRRLKAHESGAATSFLTRAQAIKRLQISLKDFRRLCILKGIHPHMPRHPKKAGKGSTSPHTFYLLKDIQLLATEPIVRKFRASKIYRKHLKRAMEKRQKFEVVRLRNKKPTYTLSHIVKERYPTFADAVRDLDDCLSMLFLFATFPKSVVKEELIQESRRLTIEFMNYIIASRSLRKVFISIKGYYYQVDICGERVTWLVPHKFPFERPNGVDFKIMSTFVEFYNVMMSFVNCKLYHSINLVYPPKLINQSSTDKSYDEDQLAALTVALQTTVSADPVEENTDKEANQLLPQMLLGSDDKEEASKLEQELNSMDELSQLFVGKKFFLNREVPREAIVFVIRSFGGSVSWDATDGKPGATFGESDQGITHQIVDRPNYECKNALTRAYVQPQWVFDSVNARKLLPVDDYLPGATLPPHMSPFAMPSIGVPSEMEIEDDEQMAQKQEEPEELPPALKKKRRALLKEALAGNNVVEEPKDKSAMKVEEAKQDVGPAGAKGVTAERSRKRTEIAEKKLREMMLPKKYKRLYHKFSAKREHEAKAERKLEEKRKAIASGEQQQVGTNLLKTTKKKK